MALVWKNALVW